MLTPSSGSETSRRSLIVLALQLAAPYLSVLVFWVGLENAWLTILSYHAQMLYWLIRQPPARGDLRLNRLLVMALPSALAGPIIYALLPGIATIAVASWLAHFGLAGGSLLAMVLYFGLIHPPLEQLYWAPLRERTPLAHLLFAGYHMIVLASLLPAVWLGACFLVLLGASVMWQQMYRRGTGLLVPAFSHLLADAGIVLAAFLLV